MRETLTLARTLLLAGCLLVGCKVATQTDLRFDAGPMTRARAVTMRVEVQNGAGDIVFMADRPLAGPGALPWPNTLPLIPASDHSGFAVVAELLDASGQVFAVQRVRSGFVRRERHVLEIFFPDQCISILCTPTTTCQGGACVQTERAPNPVPDAPSRADRQPGLCFGGYCYEHPRPGPQILSGVCAGDEEASLELVVGNEGIALRRDDDVWIQEPLSVDVGLQGVECWGQRAIAVGDRGTIVHRDAAGTWRNETSGTTAWLEDVSGANPDDAWAVGAGGAVLRRTPDGWEQLDAGTTADLTDVWSPRREEAWIAAEPALLHYADGAWETVLAPGGGASGVSGRDGELLVLGRIPGAQIYRRDGATWTQLTDLSIGASAIDVAPDGSAVASGGRGIEYLRSPGGAFTPVAPGDGTNLRDTAIGSGRALFVGMHFISRRAPDGRRAVESVLLNSASLHGVAHAADDEISALAVGDNGAVLRRARVGVWRWEPVLEGDAELAAALRAVTAASASWVIAGDGVLIERPYGADPSFLVTRPTAEPLRGFANDGARVVVVGGAGTILERTGPGAWVEFADPFPASSELTAAVWEAPNTLIVGTSGGAIWRHDGTWRQIATLDVPIGCLRHDSAGVLACTAGVDRVNATGTSVELTAVSGAVVDVVPGAEPILVSGDLWQWSDGRYVSRLRGGFEAASIGRIDTLFVGRQGVIVRLDR